MGVEGEHHGGSDHGEKTTPRREGEGAAKHSFNFDTRKRREDRGYALSLSVLGTGGDGHGGGKA